VSDRGISLASFLTVLLAVASVFALPAFFMDELLKSTVFVAIPVTSC
jgi:hypothetical protein